MALAARFGAGALVTTLAVVAIAALAACIAARADACFVNVRQMLSRIAIVVAVQTTPRVRSADSGDPCRSSEDAKGLAALAATRGLNLNRSERCRDH